MKFTVIEEVDVPPDCQEDDEWFAVVRDGGAIAYTFFKEDADAVAKANACCTVKRVKMTP